MFESITDRTGSIVIGTIIIVGTIIFSLNMWFPALYITAIALYIATFKYSSNPYSPKKILTNTLGLILLVTVTYIAQILFN